MLNSKKTNAAPAVAQTSFDQFKGKNLLSKEHLKSLKGGTNPSVITEDLVTTKP